jgi:hypothetical protein
LASFRSKQKACLCLALLFLLSKMLCDQSWKKCWIFLCDKGGNPVGTGFASWPLHRLLLLLASWPLHRLLLLLASWPLHRLLLLLAKCHDGCSFDHWGCLLSS